MELNQSLVAVVTGGASGLGEATVRALAAKGVKVAVLDLSEKIGEAVAKDVGGIFCKVDVTDNESVITAFVKARAAHGLERVLINCAGTGNLIKTVSRNLETGEIARFPVAQFELILQINLVGTFRCIVESAAGMMSLEPLQDGERGIIINTASIAAVDGQVGMAAYSASKAGVVGMTLPIARDLMNEGVRINTILPGTFATPPMLEAPPAIRDGLAAQVPFPKRFGNPWEFAHLVLAMIENRYLNGAQVRLDGAMRMDAGLSTQGASVSRR